MTISEALRQVRKVADLTQTRLGDIMGLSQAYISDLERGRNASISDESLYSLMEWVGDLNYCPYADTIRALMDAVADERSAEVKTTNARQVVVGAGSDVMVPWYTTTIKAGNTAPIFSEHVEMFNVSRHYSGAAVYEVSGDSMIDVDVHEGDRLVVKLGALFRNGDIILCRYNGELMVKGAAVRDGTIWIYPANPKYHPWALKEGDQLECVGTVIEIIRKPRRISWQEF